MSFIMTPASSGQPYAPGFFLENAEDCTRLTRQISADGGIDGPNGGKYVPMGAIWPANDGTAKGIVYEDVDVITGNMPGSVVMSGTVYEDRLFGTVTYTAVTPETGDNPAENGWYERSGSAGAYIYTHTTDTEAAVGKTYYEQGTETISSAAKTALSALGFKFITAAPVATRPDVKE